MAIADRSKQLFKKASLKKHLIKLYKDVAKGYTDQNERADDIMDYWDLYNSSLGYKQFYSGNSQVFVPIIHDALEARKTRFSNQLFPQNGRYVEVTSESGDIPYAHMALLEHYIDKIKLEDFIKALIIQGDIEGQYTLYVDWQTTKRNVVYKKKRGIQVSGIEQKDLGEYDDIEEEEIEIGQPTIEIVPDNDFLILPQNVDTIEEAIASGGSVTIIRRWTKTKIQQMIDDEFFDKEAGELFIKEMQKAQNDSSKNTKKKLADEAGIRIEGKSAYALCYETWSNLKVEGAHKLCVTWFGSSERVLGCRLNPFWCDRVPMISAPVNKIGGVFKGISKVKPVASLQYAANDFINEAFDSATFSLLPIIMTDPEKNPHTDQMLVAVGAIWETDPKSTTFAQFPQLWKDAIIIVQGIKDQIFQTLSVNPSMIPNSSTGKKKNQAEIANEQAVDVLTTADSVKTLERQILTPLLERFFEYDHQFREDDISIEMYGELGLKAKMEQVTPIQMEDRYKFRWHGVESARSAQMMQQQISGMNVLRGIPPEMYPGKKMDLSPLIEHLVENTYGPHLAPRIFKDERSQLSVDPKIENEMMMSGLPTIVNPTDNDVQHIQSHMQALKEGDESGFIRVHLEQHQQQLQQKQQIAMAAKMQQGMKGNPGAPGGGQPGIAGVPKPGSQPQAPANMKQPNGAIHQDRLNGAMPRKM